MTTALLWLLGVALFALLAWAHLRFWVARLEPRLPYALSDTLVLEDGARIELRRLPTPAGGVTQPVPILLIHGIAIDHRNNDMFADCSLARHLSARGHDVWLLTLRSGLHGLSRRERATVRFGAMARLDVPRAVREVLARTGAPTLDLLGFSMGGMLLYASLGRFTPVASVRRVVIMGSPGRVRPPIALLSRLADVIPPALVPPFPFELPARMTAFLADMIPTPLHRIPGNPDNVPKGSFGPSMITVRDVPAGLVHDFARFARLGTLRVEGVDAISGLASLALPVLFIAGTADRLAPPRSVEVAYAVWGRDVPGVDKRWVLLGRSTGASAEYGHVDLCFGTHAVREVFPHVADFVGAP